MVRKKKTNYSTTEAAAYLGVEPRRVRTFCAEGRLGEKVGDRCWVITIEELEKFKALARPVGNPNMKKKASLKRRGNKKKKRGIEIALLLISLFASGCILPPADDYPRQPRIVSAGERARRIEVLRGDFHYAECCESSCRQCRRLHRLPRSRP